MTDTILVPTDGSPESERALDIAIPLAQALDLSITLFWCWEGLPEFEESFSADFTTTITDRETTDRAAFAASLAERRLAPLGIAVEIAQGAGHPATEIVRVGEELQPRLIAISSHGRSGFKRWRLGSVADRVVRETTRDTVVVAPRDDVQLSETIKRIVVPLDGSDRAQVALDDVLPIARSTGATLLLLRAYMTVVPTTPIGLDVAYEQANEAAMAAVESYLQEVASGLAQLPTETKIYSGDASSSIVAAAEDADLVVMSSHGRGGLARMALGSVTDAVIRGSGKPVYVARSDN